MANAQMDMILEIRIVIPRGVPERFLIMASASTFRYDSR